MIGVWYPVHVKIPDHDRGMRSVALTNNLVHTPAGTTGESSTQRMRGRY